jgi:hypothetical protein
VGTVTWRSKTLKRKSDAPNHVGSGDWLGHSLLILSHNSVNQIIWPLNIERPLITENGKLIVTNLHAINVTIRHPVFGLTHGAKTTKRAAESLNRCGIVWLTNIGAHFGESVACGLTIQS